MFFTGSNSSALSLISSFLISASSSLESPISVKVVSRSITSLNIISSLSNSFLHMVIAWKVKGLSHRPFIIRFRPASILLAIAISPSRDSSSTDPISLKYILTGSSVLSKVSESVFVATISFELVCSSTSSEYSDSSFSVTFIPMPERSVIRSSICSEESFSLITNSSS